MSNPDRFGTRQPGPPGATDGGLLAGFDLLKQELDTVTSWAVRGRLKFGQTADEIRQAVPATATKMITEKFPDAESLQESVVEYVRRAVERELGQQPGQQGAD